VSASVNADGARLYIGGRFQRSESTVTVVEAATERVIGMGAAASRSEINDAVAAANAALGPWRSTPKEERADLLNRLADRLESRGEEISTLCTRENGMPIAVSRYANGLRPAAVLRYYAKLISGTDAEQLRRSETGRTIVRREPIGVVAAITPWNFPQALAAMKYAPALAAGCTVVLKAAPETSLDAVLIAEAAAESGLPDGVLNIVSGDGDAGAHLVAHPGVDKVAFTGSTAAGRVIGETCGRLIRPVTMELGGKSAAIILDDADLDSTIRALFAVAFLNSGQTCYLNSRILAPQSQYVEVVDAVAELASGLTVGDPLDESTQMGPLVSARHRDRILEYIEVGRRDGARLVTGGTVPAHQQRGWFVAPTVFADLENSARIAREEIFGPVVTVLAYENDNHAIAIANDSPYGLAGTVWSSDTDRATTVARAVRTGTIGVNGYTMDMQAPFGGVKASGFGRELGPEGLHSYLTEKAIYLVDD
jgi:aldehyde dehydrogenase (NAD+)